VLQAGPASIHDEARSLDFSIFLILPATLGPWGGLSLKQKWVPGIFLGGKGPPALKAKTICFDCVGNVGSSTFHNPMVLRGLLTRIALPFCININTHCHYLVVTTIKRDVGVWLVTGFIRQIIIDFNSQSGSIAISHSLSAVYSSTHWVFPVCCPFISPWVPVSNGSRTQQLHLLELPPLVTRYVPATTTVLSWALSNNCWLMKLKLNYDRRLIGQSVLVSGTHLGSMTRCVCVCVRVRVRPSDSCGFLAVGRLLWRGDGSVIYSYNCFCAFPVELLSGPSPVETVTIFYCLSWDSPNLECHVPVFISPGTRWPSYTPGHCVPFSSPLTTDRATVEVF
jgi:hypothetical protein